MASPGDRTVFEMLREGWHRKVIPTSGNSSTGVNIPSEIADDWNIETGDDVIITESESEDHTIEIKFDGSQE